MKVPWSELVEGLGTLVAFFFCVIVVITLGAVLIAFGSWWFMTVMKYIYSFLP